MNVDSLKNLSKSFSDKYREIQDKYNTERVFRDAGNKRSKTKLEDGREFISDTSIIEVSAKEQRNMNDFYYKIEKAKTIKGNDFELFGYYFTNGRAKVSNKRTKRSIDKDKVNDKAIQALTITDLSRQTVKNDIYLYSMLPKPQLSDEEEIQKYIERYKGTYRVTKINDVKSHDIERTFTIVGLEIHPEGEFLAWDYIKTKFDIDHSKNLLDNNLVDKVAYVLDLGGNTIEVIPIICHQDDFQQLDTISVSSLGMSAVINNVRDVVNTKGLSTNITSDRIEFIFNNFKKNLNYKMETTKEIDGEDKSITINLEEHLINAIIPKVKEVFQEIKEKTSSVISEPTGEIILAGGGAIPWKLALDKMYKKVKPDKRPSIKVMVSPSEIVDTLTEQDIKEEYFVWANVRSMYERTIKTPLIIERGEQD